MYFTHNKENETQKTKQNPEKRGCDYLLCILVTGIPNMTIIAILIKFSF